MDTNTIILALIIVAIVIVVWMKYKAKMAGDGQREAESFINYYGFDSNILDKVCPSPWCGGGPVNRQPEDAMYPTLVTSDEAVYKSISGMDSEASMVAKMAGFDLLDDGLVNPTNSIKDVIADWEKKQTAADLKNAAAKKSAAYGMNLKDKFMDLNGDDVGDPFGIAGGDYGGLPTTDGRIAPDVMYGLYEGAVLGPDRFPSDGGDLLSGNEYGDARFVGFDNGYTGGRGRGLGAAMGDNVPEHMRGHPEHMSDGTDGVFLDRFRHTMKHGNQRDAPRYEYAENVTGQKRDARRVAPSDLREGFDAAPSAANYSYAGRYIYEHPDMDGFNQTYYANPSRTMGIAPERMAYTHFNEGVGYYGRPQETLTPSADAYPSVDAGVPYGNAADLFDLGEGFRGAYVEDPRKVTVPPSNLYKSRQDINDVLDMEMRRRNQVTLASSQHGGQMSNLTRGLMSVIYTPEMYDATQNVWWEAYEP